MPRRIHHIISIGIACLPFLAAIGSDFETLQGRSFEELNKELGEPRSAISHGNTTIASYDSCRVKLRDGVVIAVRLFETEEQESQKEMMERIADNRKLTGERLLNRYRASGETSQLSPKAELDFWLAFSIEYPHLDVRHEIDRATWRIEREQHGLDERAREAEIAELSDQIEGLENDRPRRPLYSHRRYHHHHRRHHRPIRDQDPQIQQDVSPPATPGSTLGGHDEVFRSPSGVARIVQ